MRVWGGGAQLRMFLAGVCCLIPVGLYLTACSSAVQNGGDSVAEWSIEYQRSGGIAGQMYSLSLSSAGDLAVSDLMSNTTIHASASQEDLGKIESNLELICSSSPGKRPNRCRDCFTYTLVADVGGRLCRAQVTDVDLEVSGLRPVVEILNSLLTRTLSGKP